MADFIYATVRPEGYEALRSVLGSKIPETYEQWQLVLADLVGSQEDRGASVTTVEIDPALFVEACKRDEFTKDLKGLWEFAGQKPQVG